MKIYTDGSCDYKTKKGGWGFISVSDNVDIEFCGEEHNTTNNRMELTAVINCIKEFENEKNFEIYSDSQYVINCAQKLWKRNLNHDLWKIYDEMIKDKIINFIWVKAHNGDIYNEIADKLSRNYL